MKRNALYLHYEIATSYTGLLNTSNVAGVSEELNFHYDIAIYEK